MSHSSHTYSVSHAFDVHLAKDHRIEGAIIIAHFQHWVGVNQRLGRNFIDGRTWTYQTMEEIAAHFPYLNRRQVRHTIERLVKDGILLKGNFNKRKMDKTVWYAFVNEEKFTKDKNVHRVDKIVHAIPDTISHNDDDDSEHAPKKKFEEKSGAKDSPEKNPDRSTPVESNSPQKIAAENAHIKNETCAKIVRGKSISVSKTAELMRLKNLHSIATIEDLEETWQRFVDAEDEISDVKAYLLTILKKVCKKTATQNNNRGRSCRTKRTGQKTTHESTKNHYSEDTIVEQLSSQEMDKFQRFLARKS